MTWFCACRKGNGGGLWQKCKLFCKYCLRFGKLVCIMTPTQQTTQPQRYRGEPSGSGRGCRGGSPTLPHGPSDRAEPDSSLKRQMDTAAPRKRPAPAVTRRKKRDARPVCKKRGTARCGKRHRTATETPAANSDSPKSGQREATNVGSPQRGEMPGKVPQRWGKT